jgi:hypothetical protein
MRLFNIQRFELPDDYVEKNRLFNVFVLGLPRSGTSMMTHICELLGVKMIHTTEEKKEEHDKRYKEKFGEYHPNPNGFFEIADSPLEHFLEIATTPYSGCKMIIPVMGTRWELIRMLPSKVIMMERKPEEIKESQEAFYSTESDLAYIRTALASEKLKLRQSNTDHLIVNYNDVVENPEENIQRIKDFIKSDRDITEAVNFVSPEFYRQRL